MDQKKEQKKKVVSTTMDAAEKQELEKCAKELGMKKSQLIRGAIKSAIEEGYNKPVIAYAVVQLCNEVTKLTKKYENVIEPESLQNLQSAMATLIEAERVGK